ncbi:hypothetical protein VV869_23645 [Photobacterium sp. MCCC 1A19761]|uniref:hypothetical protein n=1 Tax=Photobacterium sp. MCCC 1A19761 TaxID=3115000 RepID=UPI00307F9636
MSKNCLTFVAEFDSPAKPELSTEMEICGGKVIAVFVGNAVAELDEQTERNNEFQRSADISQMYEIARSLTNHSMHSIVEGLYDAGYRKD